MTETVVFRQLNAAFVRIESSDDVAFNLWEKFALEVPGARFHPLVKSGRWDGKKRLFRFDTRSIYSGLFQDAYDYCKQQGYECDTSALPVPGWKVLDGHFEEHAKDLKLPGHIELRDYQKATWLHCVRSRAGLVLSPTASGKSLVMYMIASAIDSKTLIIVPRTQLVTQMVTHFTEYGCDPSMIHAVTKGVKDTDKQITVANWQALPNQSDEWFSQFETVFVDEAHGASAKSITNIMEKLTRAFNRFGFTGTLSGSKTHETALRGLFGPVFKATTTRELMDSETVADLDIKIIKLNHPDRIKKLMKKASLSADGKPKPADYATEYKFLATLEPRNRFITNLALALEGNTLVLFNRIEDQGDVLRDMIEESRDGRPFFYVTGKVTGTERDAIRQQVRKETNAIFLASFGTTSTGIDIPEIDNTIFGSPWKSTIINLQSIGRGIRRTAAKKINHLYDIADDLSTESKSGNAKVNHTLRHMEERVMIYCREKFDYRIYPVDLEY